MSPADPAPGGSASADGPPPSPERAPSLVLGVPRAGAAATLAGFALMAAELTAVRLQAPWFGDSAYVWTNVIGVILAALALGATFGGMLAGRGQPQRTLSFALLAAGVLLALLPFLSGPLGRWLVPGDLPLDSAMGAIIRGSLTATILLFGPPMILLGMLGPLLVTALTNGGTPVGRAAGATSACGTLGSLAGTFAATHWLVPTLGSRLTMTSTGALLGLAALLLVTPRRRALAAGAAILLGGLGLLHGNAPTNPLRAPGPTRELLAERETSYQLLQVVREQLPEQPARTLLLINEGLDSFHSIAVADSAFTGAYYDWHAIAPLLVGRGSPPAELRALSIGDAAGSLRAVYAGVHPDATVDGVDIDPVTMALGDEFFAPRKAAGDLYALDGRVFANVATARWHVIHVDAYANQIYVPPHLASTEFFARLHDRLEPDGIVALNVGALRSDDPVLRAVGTTLAHVFGHARAIRVPNSRNYLVLARRGEAPAAGDLASASAHATGLDENDAAIWRHVVGHAQNAAVWRDVGSDGVLLVDDRPVLDELMMRSYVRSNDGGEVVACGGEDAVDRAELAAFEARKALDWLGVITAVGRSSAASAYLRETAGDARWSMRELHAATAEYAAALDLTDDRTTSDRLTGKLSMLEQELKPQQRAEDIARRNGWVAVVVAALALGAAVMIYRMSRIPAAPSVSVLVDAR
ncbi:MAG: fused MFS/spermidine synthase [bacterium]|nr:fused MFS/spermidine synthase [bacterium]